MNLDTFKQTLSMRERLENLHNFNSEPIIKTPQERTLAVITLDIGEKTEIVKIYEGEDINKKAIEITKKHNLAEEAIEYLIDNITEQIKTNENNKSQISHNVKNSIDTTSDLINKSIAEIQYENWQKILQQKSKIKKNDPVATSHFNKSTEILNYRSSPNIQTYHMNMNEIKNNEERTSIYEKLYKAAIQSKNKKQENTKNTYEEQERREKSISTFKPNTSKKQKNSKNISVSPIRNPNEITEYLYNEGKKFMERKKKTEKMKEELEMEKCPFKPNINKTSKILSENNKNTQYKNIHDKLYKGGVDEEFKKEKWRKKNFDLYYPFQPNLGKQERNISVLKKEDLDEFINRLVNSKKMKDQSNTNMRIKDLAEIDKETGQLLFQPVIHKDRYYYNAKAKENHEYEEVKKEFKQHLKEKEEHKTKKKKIIKEIHKEVKEDQMTKLLREIFDLMDDDKDKWISSKHIDISEVNPYFLEIIQEILYEMEEKKEKIDFNTFISRIKEYGCDEAIFHVISFRILIFYVFINFSFLKELEKLLALV